jgi:hypothetical protein
MNNYLPYDDFLEIGENLNYGQKARVNHDSSDCSGDSNSLLVERKDNGDISAYCFRCGRSGYHSNRTRSKGSSPFRRSGTTASRGEVSSGGCNPELELPIDCTQDIEEWPVLARFWVRSYGISDSEVSSNGICYSGGEGRVILPVYDDDGLAFFQTRKIDKRDKGQKYMTYKNRDAAVILGDLSQGIVVLTEDYLSAIKVSRHMAAMPLFSTRVREIHRKALLDKGISEFIIWLDDDNLQVRKDQLRNKKELDKIGNCDIIHSDGVDPKDHTDEEIINILEPLV